MLTEHVGFMGVVRKLADVIRQASEKAQVNAVRLNPVCLCPAGAHPAGEHPVSLGFANPQSPSKGKKK